MVPLLDVVHRDVVAGGDAAQVVSALDLVDDSAGFLAAGILDVLDDGVSAVYSFFDPAVEKRSLGTFMILELIRLTKERRLPYVYLGYLIRGLSNMAYKERFAPLEYYRDGAWTASFSD